MQNLQNEYNNIPVEFCKSCLSLRIRDDDGLIYCDECGCTDTDFTDIKSWEEMYKKKYNKPF